MSIIQHGWAEGVSCVADRFEATDLGAPFKVTLIDSVRVSLDAKTGEVASYTIPNLEGLIRAVVIKRVLHRKKLTGADIKFLRKAVGIKQKDMAQRIETSFEHLSRCETGALVLSPTTEKLLRIFVLKTAMKLHKVKSCKAKTDLEDALDRLFDVIKPIAAHAIDDVLELEFTLSSDADGDEDEPDASGDWDCDQPADKAA